MHIVLFLKVTYEIQILLKKFENEKWLKARYLLLISND